MPWVKYCFKSPRGGNSISICRGKLNETKSSKRTKTETFFREKILKEFKIKKVIILKFFSIHMGKKLGSKQWLWITNSTVFFYTVGIYKWLGCKQVNVNTWEQRFLSFKAFSSFQLSANCLWSSKVNRWPDKNKMKSLSNFSFEDVFFFIRFHILTFTVDKWHLTSLQGYKSPAKNSELFEWRGSSNFNEFDHTILYIKIFLDN